ncbi:MAG: bifunctional 4-hydroxy-2-oxoglutarate aldolase/2-dehydro-3-deoxy-phosphogluconate aldolase [Alkalispirochaeta sp.]
MRQNPYEIITTTGIVPVIKLDTPDQAIPLTTALAEGGIPIAEITFRTDAAEESIRRVAAELPEILVGAGTVLTVDQVKRAADAGAQFIVTPGFNPKVVTFCIDHSIPVTPGVNSPTTVEQALESGLTLLKFFPAEASGGIAMLKALAGPYGHVSFVPTGGVGPKNLAEYLALRNVAAIGGSWIVPSDAIAAGDFAVVTRLSRDAIAQVKEIRGRT